MESNIQQTNDHAHNGTDSQLLAITSQDITAGAWVATTGGTYRQAVTVPTGFSYDSCSILFKLSTGEIIFPSVERISSTQYYVYTNDNSLAYKAYYR